MNDSGILKIAGAGLIVSTLTACQLPAQKAASSEKPNIIFILSDDVGLGDIGCFGGPFKTPNIDSLAKNGIRFDLCYSAPLCGPSRCQALTGRYPFRTGLNSNNSKDAIDPSREVMIPTVMKSAGYATASVGKWGQMCFGPGEWDFDEYVVFQGSGRYWGDQNPTYIESGAEKALPKGKYLPDLMHEFATDFITRHQTRPFFLYYPMVHIHGPILRTPDSAPGASPEQLYKDNVEYMDKLVGKLIAELDRLKLRENTLIIFTGDNGTARFGVEAATVNGKAISGMKGTLLEGGSRVPLVVNWPGTTPSGKVSNDLIDFSDFFPTFAELGKAGLPKDTVLDGHSFAPQLRGEKGTPRDWIYVELGGKSYVRNAGFKLTNHGELFDMSNAPFQEIAVPSDTKDAKAIAARSYLQQILDQHPAKAAANQKDGKKKQKKTAKKKSGL